jgi:hypothetical protein
VLSRSFSIGATERTRHVQRRIWLVLGSLVVALVVGGCGGAKEEVAQTTTQRGSGGQVFVATGSAVGQSQSGLAGVPAAALPGITVLGSGETSARPDGALIGLTIGSRSGFGPGGPTFQLVDQDELDPVVAALRRAGADNVAVDRFGGRSYSPYGQSAMVTLEAARPDDVDKLLAAAREALVGTDSEYSLQSATVIFTLENCSQLEERASKDALADAGRRAKQTAALAGVELGAVLAISEATFASPSGPGSTGCESLRLRGPNLITTRTVENSAEKVTIAVTLQVTYALV